MICFHKYRSFETNSGYYFKCIKCNKRKLVAPKNDPFLDSKGRELNKEVPPPPMWLQRAPLDELDPEVLDSAEDELEPLDSPYIYPQKDYS